MKLHNVASNGVNILVRMPKELAEQLKAEAAAHGLSLSSYCRMLILKARRDRNDMEGTD